MTWRKLLIAIFTASAMIAAGAFIYWCLGPTEFKSWSYTNRTLS